MVLNDFCLIPTSAKGGGGGVGNYCAIIMTSPNVIGFATGNSLHCEDMAQGGIKHGGRYCVAGGPNKVSCKNTSYTPGISMHRFPEDKRLRRLWTRFARSMHHPNTLLSVPPTFSLVSYPDRFRLLHFIYGEKGSGILPMREFFHPRNHKYAND